jgi:S-adenosylmethionine/arginine decarboxylase-like enzyme
MSAAEPPRFTHVLSDLVGVPAAQLRDGSLMSGLLIAAAGAGGFAMTAPPAVRSSPDEGVSGVLLLEWGHVAVHAIPALGLLMLDVLAAAPHDAGKVIEVFARRLAPREVRTGSHARG